MAIFLGIDGGGTKTSCLVGDEKSILGSGTAGPSNVLRVAESEARKSLTDAIWQACDAAGINPKQITRTCVGIAGGARSVAADKVLKILTGTISGDIEIVGDMVIAHHAAFGAGPGIVVIAGTGSVAYGRNLKGETARAGGWGWAVSDEGSGHWIGRAAVAATLREADMSPGSASALSDVILTALNCENHDALVLAANAAAAPYFAALVPAVLAAASSGVGSAADVLRRAGIELAILVKIVAGRLFTDTAPVQVAMSGGVFRNSAVVREVFYNELRVQLPHVVIGEKIAEPLRGALELARNRTG